LVRRYAARGAGLRGIQSLLLAAKTRALLAGRREVAVADLRQASAMALRHRIVLNFDGQADGIASDALVEEVVSKAVGTG
ncbi:MAG: AAA family ATPase, partial [Thermoguttaceae bacterium]